MPWPNADLWIPPAAAPGYMAASRIGIASQPGLQANLDAACRAGHQARLKSA